MNRSRSCCERACTSPPEVFLTDKYPSTTKLLDLGSPVASRIHFLSRSVDATRIPGHLDGFRTLFSSFHHLNPEEARSLLQDSVRRQQAIGIFEAPGRHTFNVAVSAVHSNRYLAIRPLPTSLPLVAALLDVFDSYSPSRSSLRRLDFVPASVLTRGTQRYDQRPWRPGVPLGDRGREGADSCPAGLRI
jgi:hypothetical protein